jgi:hypothetical protein
VVVNIADDLLNRFLMDEARERKRKSKSEKNLPCSDILYCEIDAERPM